MPKSLSALRAKRAKLHAKKKEKKSLISDMKLSGRVSRNDAEIKKLKRDVAAISAKLKIIADLILSAKAAAPPRAPKVQRIRRVGGSQKVPPWLRVPKPAPLARAPKVAPIPKAPTGFIPPAPVRPAPVAPAPIKTVHVPPVDKPIMSLPGFSGYVPKPTVRPPVMPLPKIDSPVRIRRVGTERPSVPLQV